MVKEKIYISEFSLIAPGLSDEKIVLSVLRGDQKWVDELLPALQPSMLPANERRRTTPVIKIVLQSLQPLLKEAEHTSDVAMVFASSDGDLGVVDKICQALATTEKMVSPTLFHNSVHNAPAGYCAIASSMQGPSVSLSAGDATFSSGLLDAYTQVLSEQREVLFVAYDVVAPSPLDAARHFEHSFSIAMRFSPSPKGDESSSISVSMGSEDTLSDCDNASLEMLKQGNPNAACLPLL